MRIVCPICEKAAHAKIMNKISKHHTEVYGSCLDPFCGASFVTSVVFKNIIPTFNKVTSSLKEFVSNMDEKEYQDIISERKS